MALIDAADIFSELVEDFGLGTVTYRRGDVEVTGVRAVQLDVDVGREDMNTIGIECTTRWYIPLQDISSSIGKPRHRDEIVTKDGSVYVVMDYMDIVQANACEVFCVESEKAKVWP